MAFDPNTAKLIVETGSQEIKPTAFDPASASLVEENPPKTAQTASIPEEKPKSNVSGAIIGGLSSAGADALETVFHGIDWALEKTGLVSPEVSSKMKAMASNDLNKWLRADERSTTKDVFTQSYSDNPVVGGVTRALGNTGAILGATPTMTGSSLLARTAAQTAVNVPLAAGMAGPDTQAQDSAALAAGALTLVANIAGVALSMAIKFGYLGKQIKEWIAPINQDLLVNNKVDVNSKTGESISNLTSKISDIENQNYKVITDLPGKINTATAQNNLKTLIGFKNLGPKQLNVLEDLNDRVANIQNMEDAIKLKQEISKQSRFFTPKETTSNIFSKYKDLQKSIDTSILMKADEAKVGKDWLLANRFHHEVVAPLDRSGAFDLAQAYKNRQTDPQSWADSVRNLVDSSKKNPEDLKALLNSMDSNGAKIIGHSIVKDMFDGIVNETKVLNKNEVLRKINQNIYKYKDIMPRSFSESLQGMKKYVESTGANASKASTRLDPSFLKSGLNDIKTVLGFLQPVIDNRLGMFFLEGLAKNKPWANEISKAFKSGASLAPAAALGNINQASDQEAAQ